MPPRPRSRASKSFPKTLTGILASVALAVLAALGDQNRLVSWQNRRPAGQTPAHIDHHHTASVGHIRSTQITALRSTAAALTARIEVHLRAKE